MKNNYQEVRSLLEDSAKIAIVTHLNPDGDAIGSTLALFHFLINRNYNVVPVVPNAYPDFLKFLNGTEHILVYEANPSLCETELLSADIVFCLDFNSIERTGPVQESLKKINKPMLLIDHHLEPGNDFDFIFSDTKASSTGELLYMFLKEVFTDVSLNYAIAENLYAAIMTDTGSFSFNCNNPLTYEIVADLTRYKIDVEWIHRMVYDTYSEDRMRLLGFCLFERMKVIEDLHTAIIYLTNDDLERFKHKIGDTEGIVNYGLSIKGVNMSVLLTERDGLIRLSFRSKGSFSVNTFARDYFEGGGHKNAAGANSYFTMNETLNFLESKIRQHKTELSESFEPAP